MPFNCSVCFDALDDARYQPQSHEMSSESGSESIMVLTPCGHILHRQCLEGWFSQPLKMDKCPKCNKKMELEDAMTVYPDISTNDDNDYNYDNLEDMSPVSLQKKSTSSKKGKNKRVENPKPILPPPRELPSSNKCTNEECQDFFAIHATLISDFNSLRLKCLAQDGVIAKEARDCETIGIEIEAIDKQIDKLQKEKISTLMKRPACSCTSSEPEVIQIGSDTDEDDDSSLRGDDDSEIQQEDEAAEALRIQAILEAEDEDFV